MKGVLVGLDRKSSQYRIYKTGSQIRIMSQNIRFVEKPAEIINIEAGVQGRAKDKNNGLTDDQEQVEKNERRFPETGADRRGHQWCRNEGIYNGR